jgi:CRP/FNR family transcriptional regulator/CRP/FNR family cyclic AMP-dependent transcriptional regulator
MAMTNHPGSGPFDRQWHVNGGGQPPLSPRNQPSSAPISLLERSSLLQGLPQDSLAQIAAAARRRSYRRGEVVFHQGDPGDTLLIIESGAVKVLVYSETGDETVLAIVGPGEFLGELALIDGEPRSAAVQAIEPVEAWSIRRDAFMQVVHAHPQTTDRLLAALAAKVRYLTMTVSDLAFLNLEGRLAKKLLELAADRGREVDGVTEIQLTLTQEELAGMVGATRASVNKVLGWYEDRGIITRVGRRIVIRDSDRLRQRIA